MKQFFLFLLVFIPILGFTQTLDVRFEGVINNQDVSKKEAGVTVAIVQNGQTMASGTSASNGKYMVKGKIDYNKPFDIVFSKSGFVSKKIYINLQGINLEDIPAGEFKPIESLDIDLFATKPGADFSFLNTQPVGKFNWNQQGILVMDEKDKNIMAAKIEKILRESQSNDASYNDIVKAADKAYNEKNYQLALTKYEEANAIKPKEQHPINRINEIDMILQKQKQESLAYEQENAAYINLIKAADNLRNAGDYAKAKEKYYEALDIKEEQYPRDEIAKINKLIKEKETDEKYKKLIEAADIMYKQKSFQSARDNYAEASKLKPNEEYPKSKLKELEDKIEAEKNAAALKQKYDDFVSQGEQFVKEEKWEEAKTAFEEALKIESASTYVKGQLDIVNKKLAEIKAEEEKQEKIAKLLKEGDDALSAKTYDVALAKFKEVITLDKDNAIAPPKISQIEQIIADEAKNKELNDKFNGLVKQGDDANTAKKYADAIAKYKEAIALKDDPSVQIKIDAAQKALDELENAKQLEEKFAKLVADGAKALTAKDYATALTNYEEASAIKPTDQPTLTKISEIKKIIAEQQSAAEKQEKIEKLISEGIALMEGGVMDGVQLEPAKLKFQEVLGLDAQNATAKTKIAEIDKLLAQAKENADKEAKFNENVAKGDAEYGNQAWDKALGFYKNALSFKDDEGVKQKITDVQAKIAQNAAEKETEANYQKAIAEGTSLKNAKKYTEAIAQFEKAKSLKPTETQPQQEIDAINQILADQQATEEKTKQINNLLAEGENAFNAKDFDQAKGKFEQVLGLDNTNATATKRLADIQAELAKLAGEAEKQNQINQLVVQGEQLFNSADYTGSEDKFKQVLTLDASHAIAKKYLADIAKKLEEQKSLAAKETKFNELVSKGDAAFNASNWQEALSSYNEAHAIKQTPEVQSKIDATNQKIGETNQLAELEKKYTALIKEADGLRDANKLNEAISKYTDAKGLKPSEVYPQQEIDKINTRLLAEQSKAETQTRINVLLAEGATAFEAKNYSEAKNKYQQVLGLDAANSEAQSKINAIENIESQLAGEKAKEAEFNQLKVDGMQAASKQDYTAAINHFEKALKIKDDAEIRSKIDEINAINAAAKERNAAIEALLAKGLEAFNKRDWSTASSIYQDVLQKDANNVTANNQLALIQAEIAKEKASEQNEAEFQRLKTQGFSEANAGNWNSAKSTLEQALAIKSDTEVTKKLAEVNDKINAELQAKKLEQDYSTAMLNASEAELINQYEKALEYYTKASTLKPNEQLPKTKIAELSSKIAQLKALSATDQKYNDLIAQGDELVENQNYSAAIKKYNEALALKPMEQLPVIKAKNAELLAEQQNKLEQDVAFEKIITAINTKIAEQDLKKAREYVNTAKSLRPDDSRPPILLTKIEEIEKENQQFAELMNKGEKEANEKNYSVAISTYEKAKAIKPANPEPTVRIEKLRKLIEEQASASDKEKSYTIYFNAGTQNMSSQEFELALNNFKNALNYKPNDASTLQKIAEVEKILAQKEQQAKLKTENEIAFNKLIQKADDQFNTKNYPEAIELYKQALQTKPGHPYSKKQIDEAEKLIRLENLARANQAYQNIIATADSYFNSMAYEQALESYQKANNLRPNDAYPKKKIEEINAILNPVAEASDDLEPLGEPFDGSLLDGEVALQKAELQRKDAKRTKIKEIETNAIIADAEKNANKKAEQMATVNNIYNLYTKLLSDDRDNALNKLEIASKVHVVDHQAAISYQQNTAIEIQSNYQTRDVIENQIDKTRIDFNIGVAKQIENHADVDLVRNKEIDITTSKSNAKHGENRDVDNEITEVSKKVEADQTKSLDEQILISKTVDEKRKEAENIITTKDITKYNEAVNHKQEVETIYTTQAVKAKTSEKEQMEYNSQLTVIDKGIQERNTAEALNKHNELLNIKEGVTSIAEKVSEDESKQDAKRIESVEKLKTTSNELVLNHEKKEQLNKIKNNDTKILIEAQDARNEKQNEAATLAHKDKVETVKSIESSTYKASADLNLSDDQERLNTQKEMEVKKDATRERELLEQERLKNKGEQVKETSKVLSTGSLAMENEKKQAILDTKKDLNKIEVKPVDTNNVPNALGEKYPEGVSQEIFQRKDNVGILSAIVTRRIVVINGRGSEYIRTQTSHATTYTKNGKPITEYVWQKETQDAKLQRHY
ncbi:MAG TPA: hypothetical protein VKZ44_07775 [Taishania sp.]|nr:hypothetical protein [Taishania sp.]